jgi:hypothetical protein
MSRPRVTPTLSALVLALFGLPARAADFENYLPAETQAVVSFNVRQLLESDAVRAHAPTLLEHYGLDLLALLTEGNDAGEKALKQNRATLVKLLKDKQEALKMIDFFKDLVTHIVVAVDPLKPDDPVVYFLGEWKRDKLDAFMTMLTLFSPEDFKLSLIGKQKLFEGKSGPNENFYAILPSDGVLVFAQKKQPLRDILKRVADDEKPRLSKELKALLKDLDLKKTLSSVGIIPVLGATVRMEVTVGRDIEGKTTAEGVNADTAKEMVDSFNQELDNLRKQAKDRKDLTALLSALNQAKVSVKGGTVTGSIKLPAASIEELVKKLIQLRFSS